ncbi:MAG: PAS domain S-box protein [Methanoregula sp.]|jgi:PAS domain S-box-containing protein|nr:PAS domain S-box protein [Methanoregula sp.]
MIFVLYVDDEQLLLDIAQAFLEQTGEFTVEISPSVKEALDALAIRSYDVIVSDYHMPGMDGITFLKTVRERYDDIPFILFTGRGREEVVIDAINNGADFYLQKGGDPQSQFAELAHQIRQAVRRKEAERSLRMSEERYRSVVNDQTELIARFTRDGNITFVNEAYRLNFAPLLDLSDLVGKNIREIMQVKNYAEVEQFLGSLTKKNPIRNMERSITGKDGNLHWQIWSVRALFGEGKNPDEYQVVGRDITDKKMVEEELRRKNEELSTSYEQIAATEEEMRRQLDKITRQQDAIHISEEKYHGMAERSSDLLFIINKDMSPTYVSPSARSIIGYDPKELEGKPKEFADATIFSACGQKFRKAIGMNMAGSSIRDLEIPLKRKNGSIVQVRVHAVPVMNEGIFLGSEVTMRDIRAEKNAAGALFESEQTFRTIFENSPYPIAINSLPDSRFLAINKAFIQTSGYSENEVIGKNHLELGLISLADSVRLIALFVASGRVENMPLALAGRGGRQVHVLFSTIPITYDSRPAVLTITTEVTDLKRIEQELIQKNEELHATCGQLYATEEELRAQNEELRISKELVEKSEKKFRALVENALDGILIIDFSGNLLFVNRAAGLIVDVTDYHAVTGTRNVMEFIAPSSREDVLSDFRTVAQGTDSFLAVYELITDAKRQVWIESIGKKIPFGDADAILVSIRDVTARKYAEDALRESENTFATVFKNNPVSLTLVSATDGVFVDVNEAFVRNTGYSRSEVIGRTSDQIGIFADATEYGRLVSALKEKQHLKGTEMLCRIRSGEIRTCQFTSGIILMAGRPHILSTVEDITDQKAAESAVRAIVTGMARTTGIESLDRIAESISAWLGADCVMTGEITPDGENVRVLTMLLDGRKIPDYSYALKGTPCEKTKERGFCHYPDEVARLFPESIDLQKFNIRGYAGTPLYNRTGRVIGILCILSHKPLILTQSAREIIDIIAVKAAAEIERSQLENSLRRSQQMLAEAMDLANLVNWEYDVATGLFTFDDRFYAMYGTTAEREGGTLMPAEIYTREFIHPDDISVLSAEVERNIGATDPNYTSQLEHRIIRRDGEVRHIVVRIRLTKDSAGKTIKTHGANQDITERKKAEVALRESEDKFRRVAFNAPDMIYRMALPGGRFGFVSPASVALTGYTPEEFYADPEIIKKIIHPAWREYLKNQWQDLLAKKVPPVYEFQIIDRAGKTRWVNQRNMLVTDDRGTPVAIEAIVTDMTKQKETELELRKSEQRSLAVSENAVSWIWEVSPDGLFRYSSPAVEKILGYHPDELVGKKHFYDLFDPDMREDQEIGARAAFSRREPFRDFINLNTHRNGSTVILNTSGTPLFDQNGNFTGYCGVDEDITERKKAEEALRRANHQLNLLAGITRHDILNKITVMLGYLTMAERKRADPASLEYFGNMRETIDMIRSQIEFTRIYQTIGSHEPQWFDLDAVIPQTYVPVTISLQTDVQDFSIFGDPMLEKVFFNLLDNSVRHGQRVTSIRVTARRSGGELVVVWEDNGVGIMEEEKERIFERGYGKNTGLGLFLVREILSLTGIMISETGTPGTGARFEITVPKGSYRIAPA